MIYELKETGRATALFAGWQDSVVWSALQGVMGKIYVDSLEKLESGVATVSYTHLGREIVFIVEASIILPCKFRTC